MVSPNNKFNNLMHEALNYCQKQNFPAAKKILINLLKNHQENWEILTNLGTIELQLKNFENGEKFLKKSLLINSNQPNALQNIGNKYLESEDYITSIEYYKKAIDLQPGYAMAYYNIGKAYVKLKNTNEAINAYEKCLKITPQNYFALLNLGLIFDKEKNYEKALTYYDKALNIKPDYPEVYLNKGIAYEKLKNFNDAILNYEKALVLNPKFAEAYYNFGSVLGYLDEHEKALTYYDKAYEINPNLDYLLGNLLHTKMILCEWTKFDFLKEELIKKINTNLNTYLPFQIHSIIDDPLTQKKASQNFVKERFSVVSNFKKNKQNFSKIKIGYFSSDFREHAVSYLTAELFELHDRNEFEISAFSYGFNDKSNLRERVEKSVDHFYDLNTKNDKEIINFVRKKNIDIAVDLNGFTKDSRTNIFANKIASIQIHYIGFLGTMGSNFYDYIIADNIIIPKNLRKFYSEKIIYLKSYQVNDNKRLISSKKFIRSDYSIDTNSFVFCCFNNTYKITPDIFKIWVNILKRVKKSVLLLQSNNETSRYNLLQIAKDNGLESNQLVFLDKIPSPEYLSRYDLADLFLDTFPYNAGTVSSDALRMGVPVVSIIGKSFSSRIGASILKSLNLEELITKNIDEYEKLAFILATDKNKLNTIKNKLKINLSSSLLFDTKKITKDLEEAFKTVYNQNNT